MSPDTAPRSPIGREQHVKGVLLKGVFWRIFIIEAILLVGSVAYRALSGQDSPEELFWYAVRIMLLVGVIIAFMMITLSRFLQRRIISPLETIARANRLLLADDPRGRVVELPGHAPREFKEIVASRHRMLSTILEVSEQRLRLVDFIRETFGRYVSDQVVEEILRSPEGRRPGGRRAVVTVLFSDLRGFTSLSEDRDPQQIVHILNRYLEAMSGVILDHGGIIDEFIGDAILAVFGVPRQKQDDPARACACALAMQNALHRLNRRLQEMEQCPPLEMGIALNTGPVVVGNIGSERRLKYGIVGPVVNSAARIESLTVGGQVLMGQATYERVRHLARVGPVVESPMKGLHQPLRAYPLLALGAPYLLELEERGEPEELLSREMELDYHPLEGKTISRRAGRGRVLALGKRTLLAELEPSLPRLANLKLTLHRPGGGSWEDVYAKLTGQRSWQGRRLAQLTITSMPAPVRRELETLVAGRGHQETAPRKRGAVEADGEDH